MGAHEIAEESMKIWSTKINVKGVLSGIDPASKKETEFKLSQILKELEIK